jgi:predicted oxidoreductase
MAAYESGYTFFDNADIYCRGEAEKILGAVLKQVSGMRERVLIATKGGIRPGDANANLPGRYDFSAQYIVEACEGSLERLGIETIDLYMLHRPDLLADPDEIAAAFSKLQQSGKVRTFGVSNFRPSLVSAVQRAWRMPLIAHQVEISLARLEAFTDGTLDQCLEERMTPMAWSPLAGGLIGSGAKNLLPSQQQYKVERFLPALEALAKGYGVSRTVIALAWLLKHPSGIVPILGSNSAARIREAAKATEVDLTREDWYRLLVAARGEPMP